MDVVNPLIKKPLDPEPRCRRAGAAYGGVVEVDGGWDLIFDVHTPCECSDGTPKPGCKLDSRYHKRFLTRQGALDELASITDALNARGHKLGPVSGGARG